MNKFINILALIGIAIVSLGQVILDYVDTLQLPRVLLTPLLRFHVWIDKTFLYRKSVAYLSIIVLMFSPYMMAFARLGYTNIHALPLVVIALCFFVHKARP